MLAACNSDDDIVQFNPQAPKITLDSETAIYKVKVGKEFTITPSYENAEGAIYTWKLNGEIISTDPQLIYTFDKVNEEGYFIGLDVTTHYGSASEELKVEVAALAPPVISLVVPTTGLDVVAGKKYLLSPDVQNAEDATFVWMLNDEQVGFEKDYEFCEQELGTYTLSLRAENEDGDATKTFRINVVDKIAVRIVYPAPMYKLYDERVVKYVPEGRTIYLRPYVFNGNKPRYQWSLDGVAIPNATDLLYAFTPEAQGEYRLTLTVTDEEPDEDESARRITRNITRRIYDIARLYGSLYGPRRQQLQISAKRQFSENRFGIGVPRSTGAVRGRTRYHYYDEAGQRPGEEYAGQRRVRRLLDRRIRPQHRQYRGTV